MKKLFAALILFLVAASINFAQQTAIRINDPWIRPSAEESNTALFFEVVNNSDKPDTLFKAESDLAEVVEVHETYKRENDMMGMRRVKFVVIPPKSMVKFKPRDLHVMLIKLKKDMKENDKGVAILIFKNAGRIKLEAVVRNMPRMNN
ncbi:MAG: copper chaperone PCu(A)C [Melioribacteraceae bacterium]|nr:copper chaperone PCu(A)C [Melioribacteraceae bacterium]